MSAAKYVQSVCAHIGNGQNGNKKRPNESCKRTNISLNAAAAAVDVAVAAAACAVGPGHANQSL